MIDSEESEHQESPFTPVYEEGTYFVIDKHGKESKRHRWTPME